MSTGAIVTGTRPIGVGPQPTATGPVTHTATGVLANAGGSTSGSASSATTRSATGTLSGAGATTSGAAARTRAHPSSGVLANPGGQTVGSASRAAPGNHPSTGVLANLGATTSGTATRFANHPSAGSLGNAGAQIVGSASRVAAPVTHDASGTLSGPGAVLVGFAINESGALVDTHDGFWATEYRKMLEWAKKKPTLAEVVEYVEEEPQKALEVAREVAPQAVAGIDLTELRNNTQQAEIVAKQIMVAIELRKLEIERDEDDIESILLLM